MAAKARKGRERRTLARPLVQGGTPRQPGETVELRPDQVARLEAQGILAPAQEAQRAEGSTGTPQEAQRAEGPTGTPESGTPKGAPAGGEGDDEETAK